jgi:hypothetical protein
MPYYGDLIMSELDVSKIFEESEKAETSRTEKMPDEQSALRHMFEGYQRLKSLGWNDIIYCPKDGSMFSAIEAGSTGVHRCRYEGEWPTGKWWLYDGDMWPARPILWRPIKDDDPNVDRGSIGERLAKCYEEE